MADRRQLLAEMMQSPNVTSGAASPTIKPTGASVDRNRMLMEILSQPVETPRTPHGSIAPVDATQLAALANIGTSMYGAHRQKKADAESRELLARELAMAGGGDPFESELQPIASPVLSGRVGIRPGPGADEAVKSVQEGVLPFVEATEATRRGEQKDRSEHDLAALLDPRASGLAAARMTPPPPGEPFTLGAGQERYDAKGNLIAQGQPQQSQSVDGVPMNVKEYEYWKNLPPEQQSEYLRVKRAMQFQQIEQAPNVVDPATGQPRPLSGTSQQDATQREISAAASMSAAEAGASTRASEAEKTGAIPERTRVESQSEDFAQAPARLAIARDLSYQVDDQLAEVFDRVFKNASVWTVGFGATVKPPGSPAANMAADLQTLGANAAFDRLQQMRDSSPTGGALGQVSERELALLQSAVAAIEQSQSPEQFRSNVERLQRNYQRISALAKDTEKMDSVKAQIGALQNRPQTPETAARIASLHDRMYAEEDKLWSRLDEIGSSDGATGSPAGTLPEGITEADLEYTMQQHNMTREEVLERLNAS
jgi:hypothetical protein